MLPLEEVGDSLGKLASQFELHRLMTGSYPMQCGVKHEGLHIYIIYCVRIIGGGVCKAERIAEVLNKFKSMCLSMWFCEQSNECYL